jgi:hypothetical protein
MIIKIKHTPMTPRGSIPGLKFISTLSEKRRIRRAEAPPPPKRPATIPWMKMRIIDNDSSMAGG